MPYFSKKRRNQMQTKLNTYRMESLNPFHPEKVEKIIKEVVHSHLNETSPYDPEAARTLTLTISAEIRDRVKQLEFERYKLVTLVDICQKLNLNIMTAASFLWNAEQDRYAGYTFHNKELVCAAFVYGVYFE